MQSLHAHVTVIRGVSECQQLLTVRKFAAKVPWFHGEQSFISGKALYCVEQFGDLTLVVEQIA